MFSLRMVTYAQFGVPLSHRDLLPNLALLDKEIRVRGSHITAMLWLSLPSYPSALSSTPCV